MSAESEKTPAPPEVKTSFVKETPPEVPADKKLTIPELLVKVYETELYLGKLAKDANGLLTEIRDLMAKQKSIPVGAPAPAPVAQASAPVTDPKLAKILAALLEFKNEKQEPALKVDAEENNMFYIVKTTGFLGTELFAKIAQKIKNDFQGEYVSQGRASHFRISKA